MLHVGPGFAAAAATSRAEVPRHRHDAAAEYKRTPGAQRCAADGLWFACAHPECTVARECKSNRGLFQCACPTTRDLETHHRKLNRSASLARERAAAMQGCSPAGASRCNADGSWYNCECDGCHLLRSCASSPGFWGCACPTESDREQLARDRLCELNATVGYPKYAVATVSSFERSPHVSMALVLPIWLKQAQAAVRAVQRWELLPPTLQSHDFDVLLFVGARQEASEPPALPKAVLRSMRRSVARTNAAAMHVVHCGLSSEQDEYPLGPAVQFLLILNATHAAGYHAFFVHEPDVYPVRPYWMDALLSVLSVKEEWWVRGSPFYQKRTPWGFGSSHINGNALFRSDARAFVTFVYSALSDARRGAKGGTMGAHDMVLWLRMQSALRLCDPTHRWLGTRFQYSSMIANAGDVPCEQLIHEQDPRRAVATSESLMATLRQAHPDAYLVHASHSTCRNGTAPSRSQTVKRRLHSR